MALVHLIKLRSTMAPPSIKMWDSCNWVYMGFTTFKVEVLRLLSAYLHRAASAYLCHGALSAECKYVSEFVYLLNISSKGLVTQCPLCLNRDLCGCAVSYLFWLNILIEHHGLWLSEQLINEGIVMEVDDGYICVSCGKRRKMLSKMRIHLISHGINNEYPCPFCERVPTSQDSRKRHIQTIHKKTLSYKQIRAFPKFQDQF